MGEQIILGGISAEKGDLSRNISDLEDKLAKQVNLFADISRIGTVITSIFDLKSILPMVMESAITMVKAEVGQMVVFKENGEIEGSVCWGITREVTGSIRDNNDVCLWAHIFERGEWLKISDLGNNPDWQLKTGEAHIKSLVAAPLFSQKRIVGAIVIANKIEDNDFDEEDYFILEIITRFAAAAVENSYLHGEALAKQRLEADIDMARQLQSLLMPDKLIENDRLKVTAYNTMAMQVGGDFYDIVQLSRNKFILVVADVSSKGFPASLLMTSTRSLIRAYAVETGSLSEIVVNVNEQLCGDSAALKGMFVTLIMVYLDFGSGEIRSINAGHPPGWVNYPDGRISELKTGGPFVGQFKGLNYSEQTLPLIPGSRIFLYTDGIYECVDLRGKMLGISGVRTFFKENKSEPPENFNKKMKQLLKDFSSDPDRIDDTTYILADLK
ncbi:MAG: SpoIIE family protein phosphatase [Candidatus Zixiibacteriota bacterium]|nr:MAG: SpoIIE family protein phosphatase [candidate division Zixibacteria bacterium]